MKYTRTIAVLAAMTGSILLTACALRAGPYPGVPELLSASSVDQRGRPVAPPQVVYRIDENRYFELVPRGEGACTDATVFYVDKKKGIRSLVVKWDRGAMGGSAFIIDAANDQYLVGPVTRGNTDCSSGGGSCGGARLPYSTDAGRTWKRAEALSPTDPMSVSGSIVYEVDSGFDTTQSLDLSKDSPSRRDWRVVSKNGQLPQSRKAPIDNIFHCTANGKE
ncbi:hypothetical protein WKW80_08850 [Variovorax humicola]|uniref:Tli3-like domain-containing protein n=1 Tax=Variovorax humicola TaxID=1769758 RepID=A0ABU8VWG8_9BURK